VRIRSLLVVLPLALASNRLAAQFAPELTCVAARFWRAGDSTRIELLCRVPYVLLEPLPRAGAGYRLTLDVTDSAGHSLLARRWSRTVADAALDDPDGAGVERAGFAAPAGRCLIHAALIDSASRRVVRLEQPIAALGEAAPAISDLLLAMGLRIAAPPDSTGKRFISTI